MEKDFLDWLINSKIHLGGFPWLQWNPFFLPASWLAIARISMCVCVCVCVCVCG